MPKKISRKDYNPQQPPNQASACDAPGCKEPGLYKAPKRGRASGHHWFCLEHIREFNVQWDYFADMSAAEIEAFQREAVTGHRPTWSRESHLKDATARLHEALADFLNLEARPPIRRTPALPARVRKALVHFELEYPFTLAELKKEYRRLVKKLHPDVNKGNTQSEEQFKTITGAYRTLCEYLESL